MRYKVEAAGLDIGAGQPFTLSGIKYPANWIACASADDLARIGMVAYEPAPPPPAPPGVPSQITRRQCAKALYARAMITMPEAKAMVKAGDMPSMVAALVAALPTQAERDMAEIDFAADTYLRDNTLLIALMTASGATSADIDDFFRQADAL